MAGIDVANERQNQITRDEHLQPVNFDDEGALLQMFEYLGWALGSAAREARLLRHATPRGRIRASAAPRRRTRCRRSAGSAKGPAVSGSQRLRRRHP
jgi:hypothetical protein